jgi:hypothetical protein
MKKMTNKMAKKAMGLKGFMNSMSKKKGEMGMGTSNSGMKSSKPMIRKSAIPTDPVAKTSSTYLTPSGGYTVPTTSAGKRKFEAELQQRSKNIPTRKPMMKKGGFPDLNKDGKITKADVLMGRGVINKPKAQMGMNIKKETLKNATPSIPNSYYQMGGNMEENPLSGMLKESMKQKAMAKKKAMAKGKPMPKAKKKMGMGGGPPNAFGIGIQPLMASKYQDDTLMGQSLKKGGMIKKKKK